MTTAPHPGPGSLPRLVAGLVSVVAAMVVIAGGFLRLIQVLQADGHGSRAMVEAVATLGLGGGLLALGISLLIWEMSVRYGIRR